MKVVDGPEAGTRMGSMLADAIWDAMPESVGRVLIVVAIENPDALKPLCQQIAKSCWNPGLVAAYEDAAKRLGQAVRK